MDSDSDLDEDLLEEAEVDESDSELEFVDDYSADMEINREPIIIDATNMTSAELAEVLAGYGVEVEEESDYEGMYGW